MKLIVRYGSLLALTAFFTGLLSHAQISPGDLAKVHSHLEGLSNCTKCHILGEKVSSGKCLDCHTELKSRIAQKKGYHASAGVRSKECIACHSDHHGVNFQIIRFDKEKFNHNLTGYPLTGTHAKKLCADCHKAEFIRDPAVKRKKFTYLGLGTTCLTCHTDYHRQTLPANCSECHDQSSFKPATKFNHDRAAFRLTGKHTDVPCISCHRITLKNEQKFQEFKGIPFGNCSNCHRDPHGNKFGPNCSQCHSEQSFSAIRETGNFNHDLTGFRLEGKHLRVACATCHKSKLTTPLKHEKCTDCHKDYHQGQLSNQGISPDCSSCHSVNGFAGSTFTIERHNRGLFPLAGAHLAVPCFGCHKKNTAGTDTIWRFRDVGKTCGDCHENIHKGYISDPFMPGGDCRHCHDESRWNSVSFDHSTTRFALEGAHAEQGCWKCHFRKDDAGKARQRFSGLPVSCSFCHADHHSGQFDAVGVTDCGRCHDSRAFKPASRFDHDRTLFKLEGRHKEIACEKCHKTIRIKGNSVVLYKIKEFRCEDCHQ